MKWSEQMRVLESADQVYHECVVDFVNNNVILNGKIISYHDVNKSYNARIPSKYKKLFSDPFFVSRILVYDDLEFYCHVEMHKRVFNLIHLYFGGNAKFKIIIGDEPPKDAESPQ